MTNYLEAAAELIREDAQKQREHPCGYTSSEKMAHAKLYALLAAVDKGLMPEAVAEEIYGQLRSKGGAR